MSLEHVLIRRHLQVIGKNKRLQTFKRPTIELRLSSDSKSSFVSKGTAGFSIFDQEQKVPQQLVGRKRHS